MTRRMISKYPGRCTKCQKSFEVGTMIDWSPETKAQHAAPCSSGNSSFDTFVAGVAVSDAIADLATAKADRKPETLVPGVYELASGEIYVVKPTREDKTRLYAKRMIEVGDGVIRATESGERVKAIEFVYERGAIYNIRLSDRMPIERAKELITLYGCCIACGRHLKAAKSVEQGIGPVCIKNFGPVLDEVEVTTVDGREIVRAA